MDMEIAGFKSEVQHPIQWNEIAVEGMDSLVSGTSPGIRSGIARCSRETATMHPSVKMFIDASLRDAVSGKTLSMIDPARRKRRLDGFARGV